MPVWMKTVYHKTVEGKEPWKSAAQQLLDENEFAVTKWRKNCTGVAYTHLSNPFEFEAPQPRTYKSFAVFAHEVAHLKLHAGKRNYPRWRKEIEAWDFAIDCFTRFNLPGKNKAIRYAVPYAYYALDKAIRRGAANVTEQLADYPRWRRQLLNYERNG